MLESSRGRKKFCLSKRVEEYHYIESESEESNSEEDVSSIFQILHQKALKKSKQLEIEEKVQDELERRKASFAANYAHQSSNNTSEESEEIPNYSTTRSNERAFTSTPRLTSALRPINKLALSRIETTQALPNYSFRR